MKLVEKVTLKNEMGLHARAAAKIVKVSGKYRSRVMFERDGMQADGSSILDILVLACPKGSRLTISVDGVDAQGAIDELRELIDNKFGEM